MSLYRINKLQRTFNCDKLSKMEKKDKKRDFLFALFIASMITVNTLGSKITTLFGIRVSIGIFFMPIMFLITDIIGEVYSDKEAQHFVNVSIIILAAYFIVTYLSIKIKPDVSWTSQHEYEVIFSSSMRMTLASLVSFIVSQKLDVFLFGTIRKITNGKHLWIRNNLATIISQFVDTTVFDFIAFYHMTPKYNASFVFSLILPYWAFKVVFALLDTPFCYLGIKWFRQ